MEVLFTVLFSYIEIQSSLLGHDNYFIRESSHQQLKKLEIAIPFLHYKKTDDLEIIRRRERIIGNQIKFEKIRPIWHVLPAELSDVSENYYYKSLKNKYSNGIIPDRFHSIEVQFYFSEVASLELFKDLIYNGFITPQRAKELMEGNTPNDIIWGGNKFDFYEVPKKYKFKNVREFDNKYLMWIFSKT